ncbi:DMT family transporter [Candidatus Woesebacteria bacterium]|nr:DMT family transporter [Candidatus Woesebacteria bacterium]
MGIVSFVALSMWNLGISLPALWNTAVFELSQVGVLIPALYMAVFGSIIGLTAYIWGQDGIEASEASLFTYLQPIVSIPIATLFLNERVTWPMLLAVVIIALGVMVGEMRWKQLRRKKRRPKKSS